MLASDLSPVIRQYSFTSVALFFLLFFHVELSVYGQLTVVDSVDILFNLTLQGVSLSTLDTSNLDGNQVVERLNELAVSNPVQYGFLQNALIKSIQEEFVSNTVSVTECSIGSYVDPLTGLCYPCKAGTYSETPRATSASLCLPCPAGTFSNVTGASSSLTCLSCPAGTFSGVTGANSSKACTDCGLNMISTGGAQSALACVCKPGYYMPSGGSVCVFCEEGYFCSGNVRNECPGREASVSSSAAGSTAREDCFCLAGFYGLAGSVLGCSQCSANSYCTGDLQTDAYVKNYAVISACPPNSYSNAGSVSPDQCTCLDSFKRQQSSPSQQAWSVTAQPCNCTNAYTCKTAAPCVGCREGRACAGSQTLTCPQGFVHHVGTSVTFGLSGYPASASWLIAPPGAQRVFVRLYDVNTGSGSNALRIFQCLTAACALSDRSPIDTRTWATSPGFGVVWVDWAGAGNVGSTTPFKLEYASLAPCDSPETISLRVASKYFPETSQSVPAPRQLDPTWPMVALPGDQITFSQFPLEANVSVDVFDSQWTSVMGPLSVWQPMEVGVFFVRDLSMPSRSRQVIVLPLEPRTVTVYYSVGPSASSSFILNGAVEGPDSPDIILVRGETLVMSRLSGTTGVMLLSSYNATTGDFAMLAGEGVVGQSTPTLAQTSVTWKTLGSPAGLYYYASASNLGGVKAGRVLLYEPPGGSLCVECQIGEFCYNGAAAKCPPNSVSLPGSTSVSQCQCLTGFAMSSTDLESYVNGQAVDTGGRHTCVIGSDGQLWCWGANDRGQIGVGTLEPLVEAPVVVAGLSDVRNVSLGDDFTCAVVGPSLRVKCWGSNYYGQLGLDSTVLTLEWPPGTGGAAPELGEWARLAGGSEPTSYTTRSLSCGKQSCCAIVSKVVASSNVDALTCWGRGDSNQLGGGATDATKRKSVGTGVLSGFASNNPRFSYANTGVSLSVGSSKASLVTVGGDHACSVMVGGSVWCWGSNANGAVGKGTGQVFYNPVEIDIGGAAKMVNCYSLVCCAVMSGSYGVKCWGKGGDGRLGTGVFDVGLTVESMGSNLQQVAMGANVFALDVNVGQAQTCVLLLTNGVKCWGLVGGNVIGDNPPIEMSDLLPNVELLGTRVVLQMSGKGFTTCAVMSDYRVACWGSNDFKQLGGTPSSSVMNMTLVDSAISALRSTGTPSSLSCTTCPANTYCTGGNGIAQSCPANTVSPIQSTQASDCKCLAGYKRVGSACAICSGREYCVNGLVSLCGINSATMANGSTNVSSCQCAKGYFWNPTTKACTACGWGQYKDVVGNLDTCTSCPAGKRSSQGAAESSSACIPCDPGSFSLSGSATCTQCGSGFAAPPGSSACIACGAGFFSDGMDAYCRPCPAGTYDDEPRNGQPGTCAACPAGTASPALNSTSWAACQPCVAGSVSDGGAGACRQCGVGQYSLVGTQNCLQCPLNSTSSVGSGYDGCKCAAGTFKNVGVDGVTFTCDVCGPGKFSAGSASSCTDCPSGTASSAVGAKSSSACALCSAGRYSSAGSTSCQACGVWSFSWSSGSSGCITCGLGFYASTGASVCLACPPGKFSESPISSVVGCQTCPSGSYCVGGLEASKPGGAQVVSCPLGTYRLDTGLTAAGQCTPCPANSYCPSPTLKVSQMPRAQASCSVLACGVTTATTRRW
jgi:alpha-tubulin suppressor-like RCC1 family protein